MSGNLEVMALANCGLLIKSQKAKILIDGIYKLQTMTYTKLKAYQPDDLFSSVSDEVMERILGRTAEFEKLDCLMFTHCHKDHFNAVKTLEYLRKNKTGHIFLPGDDPESAMVKKQAEISGVNCIDMDLPLGFKKEQIIKDIRVRYFKTQHYGKDFAQVPHYCFLIESGGKTLYVSGDADFMDGYQQKMLKGETVSAGFFNPLYFNHKEGRGLLCDIHAQKVMMYHVPFEKDDRYGFRKVSLRNIERYRENLPPHEVVSEELQKFDI